MNVQIPRGDMTPSLETALRRSVPRIYGIDNWGVGYFGVNSRGHLVVKPDRGEREIDFVTYRKRLAEGARFDAALVKEILPPSARKKLES